MKINRAELRELINEVAGWQDNLSDKQYSMVYSEAKNQKLDEIFNKWFNEK